jgi:hypothetical protein
MTVHLPADAMPGLDAVTDADREWFEAHPHRSYRLRPPAVAELLPGEAIGAGSRTVVIGLPGARMRLHVGRPSPRLRRDTDRSCRELIKAVDAAGYTLGGKPIRAAIQEMRRALREAACGPAHNSPPPEPQSLLAAPWMPSTGPSAACHAEHRHDHDGRHPAPAPARALPLRRVHPGRGRRSGSGVRLVAG